MAPYIKSKLEKIWKNSKFTYKTKIKIFKSNVLSVLLYGCECWRMTKTDEQKLDAFLHKSLGQLFKIYWPMQVTNEEIRARAGLETISKQVARRRWAWLGHVLRMDHYSHPRIAQHGCLRANGKGVDRARLGEGLSKES